MGSIAWTDGTGAASLSNTKTAPANRLASWEPRSIPIGPAVNVLADARLFIFEFRVDNLVSFEIPHIPGSQMPLMWRLKLHLERGGTCTVDSEFAEAAIFTTSKLAPGTVPDIRFSDKIRQEYTFAVTVKGSGALS